MVNSRACIGGALAWALVCFSSSCSKAPPTGAENPRQPAAAPLSSPPPEAATTEKGATTPTEAAGAPSNTSSPEAVAQPAAAGVVSADTAEPPTADTAELDAAELDAAPGPKPEMQHDGVRSVPRVAMSRRRAAAGNGRSFARRDIFWASGRPLALDVIHHRPGEFEALEAATRAARAAKEAAGTDDDAIRLTSHAALRTVRVGESLTLVSRTGPRSAEVTSFSAWPGASDAHLNVDLKPEIRVVEQALALRGAVAPDARLLEPRPVAAPSSSVKAELKRLRGLVSEPGRGRPMRASTAHIRTPVAGSQLLTVKIPRNDEDDEYDGFSGLLVVEPSGTTHVLVEPDNRYHQMTVLYLVDVDEDGVDEVIFESDYFETSGYVYLAVWNGHDYLNLQLSGDGG